MPSPLIYKIQKFSVHDGPGIRTTVFFKGCPLRCKWCHNPESQSFDGEPGQAWQIPALIDELEKDQIFYEQSGGGVTLSGGEPMAQDTDYITALLQELSRRGIHTAIDTCGDAPWEAFEAVLPYTDFFLYDLKLWDNEQHIAFTEASNEQIVSNLSRLAQRGAKICLRLPLIADLNDSLADAEALADWLDTEGIYPISLNLLPYHEYGNSKYTQLGLETPRFTPPTQDHLRKLQAFWEHRGRKAAIGGAIDL